MKFHACLAFLIVKVLVGAFHKEKALVGSNRGILQALTVTLRDGLLTSLVSAPRLAALGAVIDKIAV